jgi:hypothetical protein
MNNAYRKLQGSTTTKFWLIQHAEPKLSSYIQAAHTPKVLSKYGCHIQLKACIHYNVKQLSRTATLTEF